MERRILVALVTLLIVSSTALADDHDKSKCNPKKVVGSYVALRSNIFSGSGLGVLDQLTLGSDETATLVFPAKCRKPSGPSTTWIIG
jgi:hypothetical protein